MIRRVLSMLLLLLMGSGGRATGQTGESRTYLPNPGAPGAHWLRPNQTVSTLLPLAPIQEQLFPDQGGFTPTLDLGIAGFEARRSRWIYPAIGAVIGGAAFTYLTVRACQGEECIFPVVPPMFGVGLGALVGWGVDAVARSN